jgi:hypothetical protein
MYGNFVIGMCLILITCVMTSTRLSTIMSCVFECHIFISYIIDIINGEKYFKYSLKHTELTHSQTNMKPVLMSVLILQDLSEESEKRQKRVGVYIYKFICIEKCVLRW